MAVEYLIDAPVDCKEQQGGKTGLVGCVGLSAMGLCWGNALMMSESVLYTCEMLFEMK